MGLQRVPRQGETWRRLPLRPQGSGTGSGDGKPSWLRRVGWMVLLWAAGVATVGLVAILIRILMNAAGLKV